MFMFAEKTLKSNSSTKSNDVLKYSEIIVLPEFYDLTRFIVDLMLTNL